MATLGIENVQLAIIDPDTYKVVTGINGINGDTNDKTGIFSVDANTSKGIASLALSGLAGAFTPIYGSNKLVWQSQGKAAPQAVLTVNELPLGVKARALGQQADGNGGYELAGPNKNHLAVLARAAKAFESDEDIYFGLYYVQASEAAFTATSNTATEARSQDALTLSASERGDDGFGKLYDGGDPKFTVATMMADMFKATTTPTPAPAGH